MIIAEVIQYVGKRTSIDTLTPKRIVQIVELLNPSFSEGQDIICIDDQTGKSVFIDFQTYEDAMRSIEQEEEMEEWSNKQKR